MKKTIFTLAFAMLLTSLMANIPALTPQLPIGSWTQRFWLERFEAKRTLAERGGYDVVFIGDSITSNWDTRGSNVWNRVFASGKYKALNCGFSGDCTEHVLWRLKHGQLANLKPKAFVVMIGTNNTGHRNREAESPLDTALGVREIVKWLRMNYPEAKIILHPIFPRGETINDPNRIRNQIASVTFHNLTRGDEKKYVWWCDFNAKLLTAEGVLEKEMAPDRLHPMEKGYEIWAESILPLLDAAIDGKARPKAAEFIPEKMAEVLERPETIAEPSFPAISVSRYCHAAENKREDRLLKKRAEIADNVEHYADAIWLGDSITHFWENGNGREVFKKYFGEYRIFNCAFGGDRTQNQLWNLKYGGFLDAIHTRLITLMIGTNNIWSNSAEEIADGIKACVEEIRRKQPQAKLLLLSALPREVAHVRNGRDYRKRRPEGTRDLAMGKLKRINELIAPLADGNEVIWVDLWEKFLDKDGMPNLELLPDGTHPSPAGYEVIATATKPYYPAPMAADRP